MAGTVAVSSDKMYGEIREVVVSCVGDASDGTIPDTDLCALTGYSYGHGSIQGWGFWLVEVIFGTTPPTDGGDIFIKTENGSDMLAGGGVGMLKAAAVSAIWPPIPIVPIGKTATLDVNGQAVLSATYTLKLHLTR